MGTTTLMDMVNNTVLANVDSQATTVTKSMNTAATSNDPRDMMALQVDVDKWKTGMELASALIKIGTDLNSTIVRNVS